jgi:hypothetical protein
LASIALIQQGCPAGKAVLFSTLLFAALHLFAAGVRQHLARERAILDSEGVNGLFLGVFVLYKEAIKTVVGVSLTLGWLGGLLFIAEHFDSGFPLLPALLGVGLSAAAFLPAYLFSSFLDLIRYPRSN